MSTFQEQTAQNADMRTSELLRRMQQFVRANKHRSEVRDRCLAAEVKKWIETVELYDRWPFGNEAITPAINAFRLAEIAADRKRLQQEDEALEREAKKLTVDKCSTS